MPPVTRREFVRSTALAAMAGPFVSSLATAAPGALSSGGGTRKGGSSGRSEIRWLEEQPPATLPGASWGMPWPRGKHARETTFALRTSQGEAVALQSWPHATWPDGSLKLTAHALPADAPTADSFEVVPGTTVEPRRKLTTVETADAIDVDTGVIRCRVEKKGDVLIHSLTRGDHEIARAGRLVCLRQTEVDGSVEPQ
jgi:hypothetical protein